MVALSRFAVFGAAAAVWLPGVQLFFEPEGSRDERADRLAAYQMRELPRQDPVLRDGNPEWDLMTRMYTVLALAERAYDKADREAELEAIDTIVNDTIALVHDEGPQHFLLPYGRARPFQFAADRSLFVDGELAMMVAVQHAVDPSPSRERRVRWYSARIAEQMDAGPIACGESYPDECWTFCNTTALAALRIADRTLGTDHDELTDRWLREAKTHLIDSATGLLASSYTMDGQILDGPEGSSLWMATHNLRLIDPAFAQAQYELAKDQLAMHVLGFGLAKEWPAAALGLPDIDSGPIVPGLGASAGSSGLALVGAASFGDAAYFDALSRSLELAAVPVGDDTALDYRAAGPMGGAVVFYAHEVGAFWSSMAKEDR